MTCSPLPASPCPGVEALLFGGDIERFAGETERDAGGFTTVESDVDAAVDKELWELVRKRAAARRGRKEAEAGLMFGLRLMRAAN